MVGSLLLALWSFRYAGSALAVGLLLLAGVRLNPGTAKFWGNRSPGTDAATMTLGAVVVAILAVSVPGS